MTSPLNVTTFGQHEECWSDVPAPIRQDAFYTLSTREQDACWAGLADTCRQELEDDYAYERALGEEPPKRRSVLHGTPHSTATGSGRHAVDHDDPLKRIPAAVYLPLIAGVDVSSNGRCRCPMPDHEDLHPSAKAYGERWHCFVCDADGDIIELASVVHGIEARGRGYWQLRDLIVETLLWAPLHGGKTDG